MKEIAVLIADMFEDSEYEEPIRAFLNSGHRVVTVGLKEVSTITGKSHQSRVFVERATSDLSAGDFDTLFIPGGHSPDKPQAGTVTVIISRANHRSVTIAERGISLIRRIHETEGGEQAKH